MASPPPGAQLMSKWAACSSADPSTSLSAVSGINVKQHGLQFVTRFTSIYHLNSHISTHLEVVPTWASLEHLISPFGQCRNSAMGHLMSRSCAESKIPPWAGMVRTHHQTFPLYSVPLSFHRLNGFFLVIFAAVPVVGCTCFGALLCWQSVSAFLHHATVEMHSALGSPRSASPSGQSLGEHKKWDTFYR